MNYLKILILTFTFFALPNLAQSQTPDHDEPTYQWGPCIDYQTGVGWYVNLSYSIGQCTPLYKIQFWVRYGGNTYGPINPSFQLGGVATLVFPSALNNALEANNCVAVSFGGDCPPYHPFVPEILSTTDTLCPCPDIEEPKDDCIAQFEFSGNTQALVNPDFPMQFNDNEYPVEGSYVQDQIDNYGAGSGMLCYDPDLGTYIPARQYISDSWDFGDGNSVTLDSKNNLGVYNDATLSHDRLTHIYLVPGSYTVCHRKLVQISCEAYDFNNPPPFTYTYNTNDPASGGILYDCTTCVEVCVNEPFSEGNLVYTNPQEISARPSNKRNSANTLGSSSGGVNDIIVSPNPASSIISISFSSKEQQINTLNIIDITGKVLISKKVNSVSGYNSNRIDLPNIANGNYILSIKDDKGNSHKEKITILK